MTTTCARGRNSGPPLSPPGDGMLSSSARYRYPAKLSCAKTLWMCPLNRRAVGCRASAADVLRKPEREEVFPERVVGNREPEGFRPLEGHVRDVKECDVTCGMALHALNTDLQAGAREIHREFARRKASDAMSRREKPLGPPKGEAGSEEVRMVSRGAHHHPARPQGIEIGHGITVAARPRQLHELDLGHDAHQVEVRHRRRPGQASRPAKPDDVRHRCRPPIPDAGRHAALR
jgi:hypothetical protein